MNSVKSKNVLKTVIATSFIMTSACGIKLQTAKTGNISQLELGQSFGALQVDVNKYSSQKVVCDPFTDVVTDIVTIDPIDYQNGIKATLHYREDNMPRMYKAADYISFGRKSDKDIFLTDMNVPTRMFTAGFSTPIGDVLKKDSGERLIEYFGLKMTTNIVLTEDDSEGDYELAMLADDGSNLMIKSANPTQPNESLIENDGDHPTRMGCAKRTVNFKKGDLLPIEANYYQGPKYHISNVLIWRKSLTAGKDQSCGALGNHLYFNPNKNSEPQQAFKDLQARGWKILKPENFVISKDKTDYNPCVQGTAPVISGLILNDAEGQNVVLNWTTDIPATTQVQVTNMTTGLVTTTTSSNQLRTNHNVTVSNLNGNTTYSLRAVSVSDSMGRTVSTDEVVVVLQ